MKTKQIQQSKEIIIHDFDKGLDHTLKAIDYKISQINEKLNFSSSKLLSYSIDFLNQHLKSKNDKTRYLGVHDKIAVSDDANKKINKIILEDKKNLWSKQN